MDAAAGRWRRCTCEWSGTCRTRAALRSFSKHIRASQWVNWPGLESSPYYALANKYLRPVDGEPGASSVMTFGIKGGAAAGVKFIDQPAVPVASREHRRCEVAGDSSGVDDASAIVGGRTARGRRAAEMVRLSIGIESIDDILWDLERALANSAC